MAEQPRSLQIPFWFLSITVLIALTVPTLIRDGMFMDAMLYTSVSHNLSLGIGTFWFPQFSHLNVGGLPSFHEQPPLVFGIQSLFFDLLGESLYVERIYTFLTTCITAFLINKLWKDIFPADNTLRRLGWLPILLWITIPVCFWSYSNNMHENTMGIFTLCAVILIYRAMRSNKMRIRLFTVAGFFIFLASFSKGIPGFFPIAVPFIYFLIVDSKKIIKPIVGTVILVLISVIIYLALFSIPESRESLSNYLFKRALHRIQADPTVDSRFYIIIRLFSELIPQIALVLIFAIVARVKKIPGILTYSRTAIFFIAVGLAASAPIMLTMVQKGFYFVPSLPYFAIGLGLFIAPIVGALIEKLDAGSKKFRNLLRTSQILFIAVLFFSSMQIGKFSRNKELLNDIYAMGKVIPPRSLVCIPGESWNQWDLQCYLSRYFCISLETNYSYQYCIIDKSSDTKTLSDNSYEKLNLSTSRYDLYIKK